MSSTGNSAQRATDSRADADAVLSQRARRCRGLLRCGTAGLAREGRSGEHRVRGAAFLSRAASRAGIRRTAHMAALFFSSRRRSDCRPPAHFFSRESWDRYANCNEPSKIDLIHAHGPLPCGHAAMLLSAELGLPYVVSVHGLDAFSTEQVSGRAGAWCRRISQRVYRSSRRVICVSEHVREQVLEGTGPTCRTSVVYNGVDPELFSPGARASHRSAGAERRQSDSDQRARVADSRGGVAGSRVSRA